MPNRRTSNAPMVVHLPLVGLELTRSGRKRSTYWLRGAPALICLIVLMFGLTPGGPGSDAGMAAENAGNLIRDILLVFQLVVALLVAPVVSAGAIARERQENTLNLLLLANCRAHDLVLAKILAAFIQSELLLLSCLPLQGIAAFLGGITIRASLYDLAVMSAITLAMTTSGVLASAIVRRAADAYMIILGICIACCVCAAFLFPQLSPFIDDSLKTWRIGGPFVVVCCLVAIGTTVASIARVRRLHVSPVRGKARRIHKALTIPWLPRRFRLSPPARLFNATAMECGSGLLQGPGAITVMAASILVALIPFGFVGFSIMLVVAYDTATILSAAQRRGDMDLLFVTATQDRALARSIFHVQLARALVFLPALATGTFFTSLWMASEVGKSSLLSYLEWEALPSLGLLGAVSALDGFVRLLLIVAIACACAGSSPIKSTLSAAIHYLVILLLLGCLGGASVGMALDFSAGAPSSGVWLLEILPSAVFVVLIAAVRWGLAVLIAGMVLLTFGDSIHYRRSAGFDLSFRIPGS